MEQKILEAGLFSDGTKDYRDPAEPGCGETVAIKLRTLQGTVDRAWLCTAEECRQMELAGARQGFDYYVAHVTLGEEPFCYYFRVEGAGSVVYYDCFGACGSVREQYQFRIVPGYSVPGWAKGAVMYQIFVDRFYNGDAENDVKTGEYSYLGQHSERMGDWQAYPSVFSMAQFYGGDLEGVRQKLDYLQELGVEAIYFNPLFVSPSSHKYDTQDYSHIDPHFGRIVESSGGLLPEGISDNRQAGCYASRVTDRRNLEAGDKLFAELVQEIHARGMRVILDGVFNHCGSFHRWMDREGIYEERGYPAGAYASEKSKYHNYFCFKDQKAWPGNGSYEGWWGHDTLPKLNYEGSEELCEEILRIGEKWVSPPYNADGWRLDVAADLGHSPEFNHKFWRAFRRRVKAANPDAVILAEHYGDPKEWLSGGDQWDTVMNYDAFMEPVTWFLTGMEKHSDAYCPEKKGDAAAFEASMRHCMAGFQTSQLLSAMNELSNHDHSRFLTRTNGKAGRVEKLGPKAASEGILPHVFRQAVVIQMTWPGAPTVYYGDEAGLCGFTDPDNRRTYPWGREDKGLLDFHRRLICIHRENPALRTGSFVFLFARKRLLCYGRFNREQKFVIVVNSAPSARTARIDVWPAGIPGESVLNQLLVTGEKGYSVHLKRYKVKEGKLTIRMAGYSAVLLEYACPAIFTKQQEK